MLQLFLVMSSMEMNNFFAISLVCLDLYFKNNDLRFPITVFSKS